MPDPRHLAPGDKAPDSGIYSVTHYRHRVPHEITMRRGQSFPSCRQCGMQVRFELIRAAGEADDDRDLAGGTAAALD